jgi:hypothetical protein
VKLTPLQLQALAALRDGTWQAFPTLRHQGIRWRTLDSLHDRELVDRRSDDVFRFRINEAGRDAHYRRPGGGDSPMPRAVNGG